MDAESERVTGRGSAFVPDEGDATALALTAGGIVAFVLGMVRGSWLLRVLGIVAALAGSGLYAQRKLAERGQRIDAAESSIRSELDELDPVARAQILADIAREQL